MKLDPVKYEILRHRLFHILEEGRSAMINVSGSPVIAEGGECMTSIYDGVGNHIFTASGLLFHCTGSGEAINKTIQFYEAEDYIHEGDQFYFNDPYIAGTHVYDQIMVKPVFYKGKRVAWIGSMMHTGDTGGQLRGASTEIFHEGVRCQGLKIVADGKIRPDAFRNVTEQCRDPDYVGLDLKARIAANNVCEKGYLGLIEKFGLRFVQNASKRLIEEGEELARARLRSLPDGTWRSRVYFGQAEKPCKIICAMTKKGESITFDATGSSPQNPDFNNATYFATWGMLFTVLAGQLFWDVPWNGGMTRVVKLLAPEGSLLNCRYPASCALGTAVGAAFAHSAAECVAKLLYAGGRYEDVNSGWGANDAHEGPGWFYGGQNQFGLTVGQGIYDNFSSGQGAAPYRDGNDSGGSSHNAQSMISDVEFTEMNYPFVYLGRNQMPDHAGFGKFTGGAGPERLMMVYGSKNLTVNYMKKQHGARVLSFGLFGGYPVGKIIGERLALITSEMANKLRSRQKYPVTLEDVDKSWGEDLEARKDLASLLTGGGGGYRAKLPEFSVIEEAIGVGGGYGDPLDREPANVLKDVLNSKYSLKIAADVFGVVVKPETMELDATMTDKKRRQIREERLNGAGVKSVKKPRASAKKALRIHEYLEISGNGNGRSIIRCIKCGYEFGDADKNYKKNALRRVTDISGKPSLVRELRFYYQEYFCPGCGTLLQVDNWCPAQDSEEPLWDIQIDARKD